MAVDLKKYANIISGAGGAGDPTSQAAQGEIDILATLGAPGGALLIGSTGSFRDVQSYLTYLDNSLRPGTVTSFAFNGVNGYTGTVANPNSTPVLTLGTSVSGIIKGAAGALVPAVAKTDYALPPAGSAIQASDGAGGFLSVTVQSPLAYNTGTGVLGAPGLLNAVAVAATHGFSGSVVNTAGTATITVNATPTGILKSDGTTMAAAVAGDFPTLNQNTTGNAANVTGIVAGANGGTGTNNSGRTMSFAGSVSFTGSFTTAVTVTANTAVTLPTSGTLIGTAPGASGNILVSNGTTWSSAPPSAAGSTSLAPQQRLTLTSGAPIMNADVVGAAVIYATPYAGNTYPSWNGTNFVPRQIAELACGLYATVHVANSIFDLYLYNDAGTDRLVATAVAWTTTTARQAALAIKQVSGIWVNNLALVAYQNAGVSVTIPAGSGTYVGSFATTATAGQTTMQFNPAPASGGSATKMFLYNAYNRDYTIGNSSDAASNWVYSGISWRNANNSGNNTITYLDGLGQSRGVGKYDCSTQGGSNTLDQKIGLSLGGSFPFTPPAKFSYARDSAAAGGAIFSQSATLYLPPTLGLNTLNAIEASGTTGVNVSYLAGGGATQNLRLEINM